MTVNRLSGNRVLIILDGDDMRTLSLDIDSIGGKDSPSMRALSNLSRTACRRGGIRAEGRSLTVEALSFGSSCYLLVTVGGKKYLRKTATLCYRAAAQRALFILRRLLSRAKLPCASEAREGAAQRVQRFAVQRTDGGVPRREGKGALPEVRCPDGGKTLCKLKMKNGKLMVASLRFIFPTAH